MTHPYDRWLIHIMRYGSSIGDIRDMTRTHSPTRSCYRLSPTREWVMSRVNETRFIHTRFGSFIRDITHSSTCSRHRLSVATTLADACWKRTWRVNGQNRGNKKRFPIFENCFHSLFGTNPCRLGLAIDKLSLSLQFERIKSCLHMCIYIYYYPGISIIFYWFPEILSDFIDYWPLTIARSREDESKCSSKCKSKSWFVGRF